MEKERLHSKRGKDTLMDEYSSQKSMQHKKDEYVQSFTIHGLSKIFTGTKIESIFWTCVVLFGICISNFVIYGLISKYYRYEIYTEVAVKVTNQNLFPAITFCDNNLMIRNYFSYCGIGKVATHPNRKNPCTKALQNYTEVSNVASLGEWSNGLFHVKQCYTWGSKYCANDKYLKSLAKHNNTCFTFNWNGDLYDPYSHAYIEFQVNKTSNVSFSSHMVALIHDPKVLELEVTNRVIIEPSKTYELKVSKTVLQRLPYPFPSNCTNGKMGDIFPGKYTRRTCLESINYINMLKHCGDVLDYHKRFVPKDVLKKYQKFNQSMEDVYRCMLSYSTTEVADLTETCPVPCEEVELYTMAPFDDLKGKEDGDKVIYRVHLQYQNVDAYKIFREKQLHTWDQIAGEVGGFLGLVIGASFISIIEIFAYFMLCLLHKLVHGNKRENCEMLKGRDTSDV